MAKNRMRFVSTNRLKGVRMPAANQGDIAISEIQKEVGKALVRTVLPKVLKEEAQGTMELARDRYCPIDTGALRSTGRVGGFNNSTFGNIHFGDNGVVNPKTGKEVDYALYVHEIPMNHPVGQWKFLETATMERMNGVSGRVAKGIASELGL